MATSRAEIASRSRADFYPRHPRGWRPSGSVHAGDVHNFYPRHPRGWRRWAWFDSDVELIFLSTPPSRVATDTSGLPLKSRHRFLSTPPSRVATYRYKTLFHTYHRFYPRHPRVWRRSLVVLGIVSWLFLSTPPSRVATFGYLLWLLRQRCFYPRHPRGWRLRHPACISRLDVVSIHATLAGGDGDSKRCGKKIAVFLSTPPSRVATDEH